jgi:hypothetical protein
MHKCFQLNVSQYYYNYSPKIESSFIWWRDICFALEKFGVPSWKTCFSPTTIQESYVFRGEKSDYKELFPLSKVQE